MVGVGNTAEVFDYGDGKVCKLFFAGYPKDAVEREFRNATEVQKLSLSVPKVYETIVLESRNGIVYEKIEGKSLLDCIFENTGEAATCLEQFVRLQKEWLTVCSDAVVSYKEFLRGMVRGNGQAEAALLDEIDALPEGNVLLHGDFHPGNILITPNNRAVVIDFMNVCRGPALYDVARTYFLLKEKDDFFGTAYLAMMEVAEEKIGMFYSVIEQCRKYERRGSTMDLIKLISPTIDYAKDILQFRAELLEAKDEDAFAGCGVGDASLEDCTDIEKWLEALSRQEHQETCPEGGVPSNFYLAVRISDNKIVGGIDLRHHIDHPILGTWGGHMGYSVRPSERGKGYAKEMLRLNLLNCKARGIKNVLVTCSKENPASEKVILANGGVFEKEIDVDGEYIKRYWITL